jgi:hypothetical protein
MGIYPAKRWKAYLMPPSPPPQFSPAYTPGIIVPCRDVLEKYLYFYLFARMANGYACWVYPVNLTDDIVRGFAWDGKEWAQFEVPVHLFESFY